MARVNGKPTMVSERYLGSAEDIAAAMASRDSASLPERTRHGEFGDVAAVWGMLDRLDVAGLVDEVVGACRSDAGASVGTYLVRAACNRVVDPCSKRAFADWWTTTAADRFTKISAAVLDHRRLQDAMHAVTDTELAEIAHRLALRMIEVFELDVSALALAMTNFATYIDTTNTPAPIAQRGKAKQKRPDLRLVGLGLVVTRDGGIPLVSHAYPGNRPDVTQFATMIDQLCTRHTAIAADRGQSRGGPSEVTVVFDAGQNSVANFAHLAAAGWGFVGSVPPSDCPDLLARPATDRSIVDEHRFDGLTALDTRRTQDQVTANIERIIKDPWVRRVISWELTGDTPPEHRLTFHIDDQARTDLETEIFGKRVLITDRQDWPITEVVAGYRSNPKPSSASANSKTPMWSP